MGGANGQGPRGVEGGLLPCRAMEGMLSSVRGQRENRGGENRALLLGVAPLAVAMPAFAGGFTVTSPDFANGSTIPMAQVLNEGGCTGQSILPRSPGPASRPGRRASRSPCTIPMRRPEAAGGTGPSSTSPHRAQSCGRRGRRRDQSLAAGGRGRGADRFRVLALWRAVPAGRRLAAPLRDHGVRREGRATFARRVFTACTTIGDARRWKD